VIHTCELTKEDTVERKELVGSSTRVVASTKIRSLCRVSRGIQERVDASLRGVTITAQHDGKVARRAVGQCTMNPQIQRMLQHAGGPPPDSQTYDTAETIHISSLSLLKMLKHGTVRKMDNFSSNMCRQSWGPYGSDGIDDGRICG